MKNARKPALATKSRKVPSAFFAHCTECADKSTLFLNNMRRNALRLLRLRAKDSMQYSKENYEFGPVAIIRGPHRGRIGRLDDTTHIGRTEKGVIIFAPFAISSNRYNIHLESLQQPNTQQLLDRYHALYESLSPYFTEKKVTEERRVERLEELIYIQDILNDRMFTSRFTHSPQGAKIFLSHSSRDKDFVKGLAVDLANLNHQPWLDDWEILAGESIPDKVSKGIEEADFVLVVLSENAIQSQWVKIEWQTKFWLEVSTTNTIVIPILIESCEIPALLKTKKYINFQNNYSEGLSELAYSIGKLMEKQHTISK